MGGARMWGGVAVVAALGCGWGWGQTEALHVTGPLPSFEVATIKLPHPDPNHPVLVPQVGTSSKTSIVGRVRILIAEAYQVDMAPEHFGVVNLPAWTDKAVYSIEAKMPDEIFEAMQKMTLRERMREQALMLQSLLAERFKLKVHFERREEPVYELVAAKGGLKLPPPVDQTPGPRTEEGKLPASLVAGAVMNPKTGLWRRTNLPLEDIFRVACCGMDGRRIVNKTGLTGNYSVTLNLGPGTADESGRVMEGQIFKAAEEQLGVRLVPGKAMVEVVVVDHIEMPTEN